MKELCAFAVALGAIGAIASAATAAKADSHVVYQGYLEYDGQPYTGMVDVAATFFTNDVGNNEILENGVTTSIVTNGVDVEDGVFSVLLPLADAVLDSSSVFLEIELGTSRGTKQFTPRQRIYPTAFALGGAGDGGFSISGNLEVAGSASVIGDVVIDETITARRFAASSSDLADTLNTTTLGATETEEILQCPVGTFICGHGTGFCGPPEEARHGSIKLHCCPLGQ